MKLKIPPAIQVAVFASLIWLINKLTNSKHLDVEYQEELSWFIFAFGLCIGIIAIYYFRKARTTADPLKPEKASQLVINGIYKFTRNPMYLGMFFILLAFAVRIGNLYSFTVLVLYIWYITIFQIKPEEEALNKLFGKTYTNYCKKVRRWI